MKLIWTDPLLPTIAAVEEAGGSVRETMVDDIRMIGAVSINGIMGLNSTVAKLPWKCKSDMEYFKETTRGQTVVMGKTTCLSLKKPLDGRTNIVLSRDPTFERPGFRTVNDYNTILREANKIDTTWIIGGPEIYRLFIDHVVEMHLSVINQVVVGDVVFPTHLMNGFDVTKTKEMKGCTTHILHRGSAQIETR